jgi:hypothetical protein
MIAVIFLGFTRVSRGTASRKKGRLGVAAACALGVCLPSAGFAVVSIDSGVRLPTDRGTIAKFTPASLDPRMARLIARNSTGPARLMRFTPAGVPERASRSMTVAVRVDEDVARAISVRSAIAAAEQAPATAPAVRIAPMRFNLGMARGYQSFAKAPSATPVVPAPLADAAIPDIATLRAATGARESQSRFVARKVLDDVVEAAAAPRAIEPAEVVPAKSVDVAGSYRLTRNLDVTAGLRYSQDRERLMPLADAAKQDSQAVYVGTQFRF